MLMENERDYGRVRGKQPQRDNGAMHEDGVATKLALEIEKKELKIMKKELAMQARLYTARSYSSDEEEERIGEEWVAVRRDPVVALW
jgi:DNA-directed RNA polymerase alpha subunit